MKKFWILGFLAVFGVPAASATEQATPSVFVGTYELESENTGSCYTYLDVTLLPWEQGVVLKFWEPDPNLTVAPVELRLGKKTKLYEDQDVQIVSEGKWTSEVRKLVYYDAFIEQCSRYPVLGTKCKGNRTITETKIKMSPSGTLLTYNFQKRLFLDPLTDVECEYRKK